MVCGNEAGVGVGTENKGKRVYYCSDHVPPLSLDAKPEIRTLPEGQIEAATALARKDISEMFKYPPLGSDKYQQERAAQKRIFDKFLATPPFEAE